MRKIAAMKLTNRLVAFVTLMLTAAIFVLFIGGSVSFRKLGNDFISHYLSQVVYEIDRAIAEPSENDSLNLWLPKLLKASDVVELEILSDTGMLYRYQQVQHVGDQYDLLENRYTLPSNPGFYVNVKSVAPYAEFAYSIGGMLSLTMSVLVIVLALAWGIRWLRLQLEGAELLEERGKLILAGRTDEVARSDEREWPVTASVALDRLISRLKDARQERSRFDTFLRSNTFLDQLTGMANRVMFDNRLHALVQEQGSHGAVMMIKVNDLEELVLQTDRKVADEWIKEVGVVLSNAIQRYPDAILARYFDAKFTILLVQQSEKETELFAGQLMRALERLDPPQGLDNSNWCHLGAVMFTFGESRGRLMDEVEEAVRSAELQEVNSWSLFRKSVATPETRGSVRWRTLLNNVFEKDELELYTQVVKNREGELLYTEVLARINDEQGRLLKASRFIRGVELVGMTVRLDCTVVSKVIARLQKGQIITPVSINLSVYSLKNRHFQIWLRNELMQMTAERRGRILFEVAEGPLVTNFDAVFPTLRLLSGLGCRLVVDQAGRTVVSTHYVKDIQPEFVKLHRSLVRDIHQRPENQLYIRSMLGTCEPTSTGVVAVGVETRQEWKLLLTLGVYGGQGRLLGQELSEKPIKPTQRRRQRWRRK
ncbi:RNase E specificity factor CsrD [Veronia pacifica]|uniref:RNase E specificity factor CsrD n=1 Tax=Veronia pacifica TaxID=1080227 RepID=A0A1C3ELP0_9GAMM|nr:RNase E specificity factor CsrD [Veronia pacifica]ODA34154.1 RNase E specificity factor CsrD [Veronia pacifica]